MKILFFSSLLLPAIYIITVLTGMLFDFRLNDFVAPYSDLIIGVILVLTFFFVVVCEVILLLSNESKGTKLLWGVWLFLLNMLCVPVFLYCYNSKKLALN